MSTVIRRDTRRRLDQFVANPSCEANTLSSVHDIPMDQVAKLVGVDATYGQSPFAIARGMMFERLLFEKDAERLRKALVEAGVLSGTASGFLDLRLKKSGGPAASLDAAMATFDALLRGWSLLPADRLDEVPSIIASPVLQLPGRAILPDGMFAVDVIVTRAVEGKLELRIGEIKVYPDRGGFTDAGELSSTRAQAGIYLHALQLAVSTLPSSALRVATDGFLVLTKPGSNFPSVRAGEDLSFQSARAARAMEQLREVAALAVPLDAPGKKVPEDRLAVIRDAPKAYCEGCISFCELAEHCHAKALDAGDGAVLGQDVARFLGSITLPRAIALMEGKKPKGPVEEDFKRRVDEVPARRTS